MKHTQRGTLVSHHLCRTVPCRKQSSSWSHGAHIGLCTQTWGKNLMHAMVSQQLLSYESSNAIVSPAHTPPWCRLATMGSRPDLHGTHGVAALWSTSACPASHVLHDVVPLCEYVPAGQIAQAESALLSRSALPASHFLHDVYNPSCIHPVFASCEIFPTSQSEHKPVKSPNLP